MLNGCATTLSQSAASVKDADMKMVENCKFLGEVYGSSYWAGFTVDALVEAAKNEARGKAASLGATHIVWQGISGSNARIARGSAYLCK